MSRPNWFRRRWMDLREVWRLIVLGSTTRAPRFCNDRLYVDRLYTCDRLHGHSGAHASGPYTWQKQRSPDQ